MKQDRLKKLNSVLQNLVTDFIFKEVEDFDNKFWIITVTDVKISPDLSYLDIYVSSFENGEELPKFLAWYAFNIERQITKQTSIRKTPRVRFRYDSSWEISWEVISTIKNLKTK